MQLLVLIAALLAWVLTRSQAGAGSSDSSPSPTSGGGSSFEDYEPVDALTEAWAHVEGWDQQGSLAQRNNNPVNIKGSWDGVTGHTPAGFAEFSDPSFGWGAAESWIEEQAQEHPDWTLRQLFAKVLGSLSGQDVNNDQGNSVSEADAVAEQLGVPSDTNLAAYLGEQNS